MNNKATTIKKYFDECCKDAKCTLDYTSDFSLLIAIMLSAQCTDKKVNTVTKVLFSKYKSLEELNNAKFEDILNILNPLGLYKNKAKYLVQIVDILINKYNGNVPCDKKALMLLPGIGNKTANVFLAEWCKIPEFPVDTHVNRVAKRLDLANNSDSVLEVEKKLCKTFKEEEWIDLHHKFIHFGRNYCLAQNPKCENCEIKQICKYYKKAFKVSK